MMPELFIGKLRDIARPDPAIFREVILVETAKGICIHIETHSSLCGKKHFSTNVPIKLKYMLFIRRVNTVRSDL